MINTQDVVRLKIPFPSISSALAYKAHMYICHDKIENVQKLVKCQTYKLSVIMGTNAVKHYIKEKPNIERNPFNKITLIDCDKSFNVQIELPESLLPKTRRNVCKELHSEILSKLQEDGYKEYMLSDTELQLINSKI